MRAKLKHNPDTFKNRGNHSGRSKNNRIRTVNRYLTPLLILVFVFITSFSITAQHKDTIVQYASAKERVADSLNRQQDIFDLFNKIFGAHISSKPDTLKLRPGKLFFALVPAIGYTLEGNWLANVSLNTSFYTANPSSTNLSTINYGTQYDLNHQLIVPVISDLWLKNNTINLLGDWRYYIYPSYTYGLGGNTSLSNSDLIDYSYIRFYQEVLGHFNSFFYFGGGFNYDDHFFIKEEGTNPDYNAYTRGATQTISSGPVVHFMYDSRSNINNPIDAFYGSVTYRYSPTVLGSTQQWQSVFLEFKKYIKLWPSSPNVLALWSWNVFTFGGNAPYFDMPSNGWDINNNSGRGYIQGRFRGQNMIYDEAEYRFRITGNGLLGGVLFANAESVTQYPNNKFEYIDPGYGVGLRLKMNKYSDVNLCFDYGFGIMGSRGLFVNLGEVF